MKGHNNTHIRIIDIISKQNVILLRPTGNTLEQNNKK